jgi:N-methylhydantoinase A/oxoprolinase/acetone carboxylase beta subunit
MRCTKPGTAIRRRPRRPKSSRCAAPSPACCASRASNASPPTGRRRGRDAHRGARAVFFAESGGYVETPTYHRSQLKAGNRIAGPAVIEEYASTTLLHPGDAVEIEALGDLVIDIRRS